MSWCLQPNLLARHMIDDLIMVMHVTESCVLDIEKPTPHGGANTLTQEASPWSDGPH